MGMMSRAARRSLVVDEFSRVALHPPQVVLRFVTVLFVCTCLMHALRCIQAHSPQPPERLPCGPINQLAYGVLENSLGLLPTPYAPGLPNQHRLSFLAWPSGSRAIVRVSWNLLVAFQTDRRRCCLRAGLFWVEAYGYLPTASVPKFPLRFV